MKTKIFPIGLLTIILLFDGCASMNNTQKGVAIGAGGGAAVGAVIGKISGNTALGTIIGAAVGGTTGAVIGRKMDKQAAEIEQSIPDAKVERVGEGIAIEFDNKILFGYDSSTLSANATSSLNKLVSILNTYPDTNIEVQGHTDSSGTETYNQALSERRAGSVSSFMTQKGISGNRITTVGFGELYPKYDNANETGRAQNRRVEFLITANEKMISDSQNEAGR